MPFIFCMLVLMISSVNHPSLGFRYSSEDSKNFQPRPLIAVVEGGFGHHEELEPYLARQRRFSDSNISKEKPLQMKRLSLPERTYHHGTHVAGIIAQNLTLSLPCILQTPFPHAAKITEQITVRVQALESLITNSDVKIVNLSQSFNNVKNTLHPEIESAIRRLAHSGKLIIMAAGNDPSLSDTPYTHSFHHLAHELKGRLLFVKAYDEDGKIFPSTLGNRRGFNYCVSAPGINIQSTVPYDYHSSGRSKMSGTSMATPYISALAHNLMTQYPHLTIDQISSFIRGVDLQKKPYHFLYSLKSLYTFCAQKLKSVSSYELPKGLLGFGVFSRF